MLSVQIRRGMQCFSISTLRGSRYVIPPCGHIVKGKICYSFPQAIPVNFIPSIWGLRGLKTDVFWSKDGIGQAEEAEIVQNDPVQLISQADNVGAILAVASSYQTCETSISCLNKLSSLKRPPSEISAMLLEDKRFTILCDLIMEKVSFQSDETALMCVKSMLGIFKVDLPLLECLENHLEMRLIRMPISLAVQVLLLHHEHQETELRKQTFQRAIEVCRKRWVEIPSSSITLLMGICKEDSSFLSKLEERALDVIESLTTNNLYFILYQHALQKHRNTPLIKAIVYHITKNNVYNFNVVKLRNMFYACCILNIYDVNLLAKLTTSLRNQITAVSNYVIPASVISSFGVLRWYDYDMLNMLISRIEHELHIMPDKDITAVLRTLSCLNYPCVERLGFVQKCMHEIKSLINENPTVWLEMVWCLAVLEQADADLITSVLEPSFIQEVIMKNVSSSYDLAVCNVRLQNLFGTAKLDLPDYSGPSLPDDIAECSDALLVRRSNRTAADSVMSILKNMAPVRSCMQMDAVVPYGYVVGKDLNFAMLDQLWAV
ncbi:hypothetical protein ACJMK2_022691 [Sinanodonta woodiana]|uniref:Uncharacterized protein n=1 Tax=Sinanodonta woodiana TaxID=1069815 RepID=A0ABD3TL71_SINWO